MIPQRIPYLLRKKEEGWKVFGILPGYYPKEILLGAEILPVEIWDPRVDTAFAYRHLQHTVCGIVKRAISFLMALPKGLIDGILVPHTCDSLQNLGTLIKDLLPVTSLPCIFFYPPKGPYRKSSFEYFKRVLKVLQRDLEAFGTQAEGSEITRWLNEMAKVYQAYRKLFELLTRDLFPSKNRALLDLIKGFGYLLPNDILEAFGEISKEMSPNKDLGPKVFISGIYPYEVELIEMLDLLKARIVAEDSLFLTRRFPNRTETSEDPYEELAYRYFSTPPCPTRGLDLGERADYLIQRARSADVKGVLFGTVKFCEPESFDLPTLISVLNREGLNTLHLEMEPTKGMDMAYLTRLEAFLETL